MDKTPNLLALASVEQLHALLIKKPQGTISFASKCVGGHMLDKQIVENLN